MNAAAWERAKSLLAEAADLPPGDRERYVTEHCSDPDLRVEVLALLGSPALLTNIIAGHALRPGDRLGPYVVDELLGIGGMGEVYRARDTKLGRHVALKILPASFTTDPERVARFRREAQVLASLNHPHIAQIYGLEETNGTQFLVLELVDGESLDKRIARGKIPVDEALAIAKQIAEALEAAHEKGIIHRDLKPANIALTSDGQVKVLDFGLAKAVETMSAAFDATNSPTITSPAMMTGVGVILGTAAYVAPEQANGRAADKRSDIWAFGCVLFEMLAGKRLFVGVDVSDTLAAVLRGEPDWTKLPSTTSPTVRRLLRRCLEKDRKRRLDSAADARLEIEDALTLTSQADAANPERQFPNPVPAWRQVLPWSVVGVLIIFAGVLLMLWSPPRSVSVPMPRKLLADIGADASLPTEYGASAILSPNGTTLAFVARQAGHTRLFVRTLDQLQAAALAGTEGAANPFFSPDGQWIAFFAGGQLRKVPVTGGAVATLCNAPADRGGTWADDDTIIFTPTPAANTTLLRVPARGGTPAVFGTLSEGATTQRWPQVLPGGKGVLYTELSSAGGDFDRGNFVVAPLAGGMPKVVLRGAYSGRYVPSGHLIYMQQGTLFAVGFDLDRLETIGQAVPALEGVAANPNTGGAQVAVSSEGTLVYVPGPAATAAQPIDWMTRDGKTSVLRAAKAVWANPRFSPDGQKLALEISDGKYEIWVYEWARDRLTQLTFDVGEGRTPIWTPDGRRIVFASDRAQRGIFNLYWVNADGTGGVTRLTDSPNTQAPWSWHPSGSFLAFGENRGAAGRDVMILPMEGDAVRGWTPGTPSVFLSASAGVQTAMFSPDGRWIAYTSNVAGGSFDVYVRPFPGPGGPWRVSTEGGGSPRWSATTRELLFLSAGQSKVMFAPYTVVGESFRADKPQIWSPTRYQDTGGGAYDLHPDGKRLALLVAKDQGHVVEDKVVFVFNFFDYLRRIAPIKK